MSDEDYPGEQDAQYVDECRYWKEKADEAEHERDLLRNAAKLQRLLVETAYQDKATAEAALAALAESGTGYSQQTVDAITREREELRAALAALNAQADAIAVRRGYVCGNAEGTLAELDRLLAEARVALAAAEQERDEAREDRASFQAAYEAHTVFLAEASKDIGRLEAALAAEREAHQQTRAALADERERAEGAAALLKQWMAAVIKARPLNWAFNPTAPELMVRGIAEAALAAERASWRCFKCGMVLTDEASARNHFGDKPCVSIQHERERLRLVAELAEMTTIAEEAVQQVEKTNVLYAAAVEALAAERAEGAK